MADSNQDDAPSRPLLTSKPSRPTILSKPTLRQRQSSTFHYQTFPTAPPRNAGKKPSKDDMTRNSSGEPETPQSEQSRRNSGSGHQETPLPKKQLAILAVIALAEQTALNSISPYLPEMASTFPEVKEGQVGLYVGLIASSFALAQFATNFAWGFLSDRIGRKPVVLCGTLLTAACFVAFGFCRTLWQAVLVQALMGLVNGNQGVISTCLGEITDRSNQSRAFTYLPVIYGLGGITGPVVGGLLVMRKNAVTGEPSRYPYLAPNLFSAAVLLVDLILTMFFLEESLEGTKDLPPLGKRVGNLFTWMWQFTASHSPTYLRRKEADENGAYAPLAAGTSRRRYDGNEEIEGDDEDDDDDEDNDNDEGAPTLFHTGTQERLSKKEIFTRDTILLLATFLIFQLGNISYNSLYPIFAQETPPTGRDLSPEEIGLSLAFAGVVTILFQIGIFGRLREKIGNKVTYRIGLGGMSLAFILMPFVGYKGSHSHSGEETTSGRVWLWIELGAILIIKTVAAVGSLTSALLLITNSAPSHAVLGTLNGLAQTLSAAGRAVGPFISGSLFTLATKVQPKGEALAFGVFAGISFIGFLLSFGIRGADLEADGWEEEEGEQDEEASTSDSSPERRR